MQDTGSARDTDSMLEPGNGTRELGDGMLEPGRDRPCLADKPSGFGVLSWAGRLLRRGGTSNTADTENMAETGRAGRRGGPVSADSSASSIIGLRLGEAASTAPGRTSSASHAAAITAAAGAHRHRPSRRSRLLFSSLTIRIIGLNFIGLLIFMIGLVISNQYRNSTVDERIKALNSTGALTAKLIGEYAKVPRIDASGNGLFDTLDPLWVRQNLLPVVAATPFRAKVYDIEGRLIYDTWLFDKDGEMSGRELDSLEPAKKRRFFSLFEEIVHWAMGPALSDPVPLTQTAPPEVFAVLEGSTDTTQLQAIRRDLDGDIIVSVAVPVSAVQGTLGVVWVATKGDDFERVLWGDRLSVFIVFAIALLANVLMAFLYGSTVTRPIQRLAQAADRIRFAKGKSSQSARSTLPDYGRRADEIGTLATSLRAMTDALHSRLKAIENFAADVSHEIKTPLTSMVSAIETLEIVKKDEQRKRLMEVLKHDVARLDRLITDISNASRLDAELSREDAAPVHVPKLIRKIAELYEVQQNDRNVRVEASVRAGAKGEDGQKITGIESRIGQVLHNLVENAISFSPKGGAVRMSTQLNREDGALFVQITVDDEGPGIPEESLETIFNRFYTSRPEEADFGQNSGLGLSISKQIVEAHQGRIWAENRMAQDGAVLGARFTVLIPAASGH